MRRISSLLNCRRFTTTFRDTISLVKETNELCMAFEEGRDVTLLERIKIDYEKAAMLDNEEAMYRLGRIYVKGWINDDPIAQRGKTWLEKAAMKGHTDAMFLLAIHHRQGEKFGFIKDPDISLSYLRKAAGLGHAESLFALGIALMTGEYLTRDLEQAAKCLNDAAKRGHELAQCSLAALLIKEHYLEVPSPRNLEESVEIDNYAKAKEALLSVKHDESAMVIAVEWLDYLERHIERKAMSPSIQAKEVS